VAPTDNRGEGWNSWHTLLADSLPTHQQRVGGNTDAASYVVGYVIERGANGLVLLTRISYYARAKGTTSGQPLARELFRLLEKRAIQGRP
jgi:hypothetical protein